MLHPKSSPLAQIAATLSTLLLIGTLSMSVASANGDESPGSGDVAAFSDPAPVSELPEKRTATSDTYELHSGRLETRVYGVPVNYKDAEGEWQPIDEGLEEADGGEIVNGANSVDVRLPSELQDGAARLTVGNAWIASKLLSLETEPAEVEDGVAVYASPEAGAAFEYTTLAEGLKEEIVLKDPSSLATFRYELTASTGLTAVLLDSGSVVFKDDQGDVVASMPAPTVTDAESLAPNSDQVGYQLAPREGGAWVLTITVEPEWLSAAERSWPVRIDPTMTAEKPVLDCVIGGKTGQEGWIDCASWGRQDLLAGYTPQVNQAEDSWYRSLMYLSTAGLPPGANVLEATLQLHSPEAALSTSGIAVHQVLKPWNWQANWKRYTSGKNWSAEGGDYALEALGELSTQKRKSSAAGWWSVPLVEKKVQEAFESESNLSALVKLRDDKARSCNQSSCTQRRLKFDSSAASAAENRPYLRLIYDFGRSPTTSKITSPEDGRRSGHYFTLQSAWDPQVVPGTTGVSYQIKFDTSLEFRTIPAKYLLNGKGEQPTIPQPVQDSTGSGEPLYFDYRAYVHGEPTQFWKDFKLRALFHGSQSARGASEPVSVEYVGREDGIGGSTDAAVSLGPAAVNPLTGNYTLSRTDVSIPIPGSEANLEFSRTYESMRKWRQGQSQALGGGWEPSSPTEQEFEGEAWTALIERHEDASPPVYDEECWTESGQQYWKNGW